jgi:hypothetical protein
LPKRSSAGPALPIKKVRTAVRGVGDARGRGGRGGRRTLGKEAEAMRPRRSFRPGVQTLEGRVVLSFSFSKMLHSIFPFIKDDSAPKKKPAAHVVQVARPPRHTRPAAVHPAQTKTHPHAVLHPAHRPAQPHPRPVVRPARVVPH